MFATASTLVMNEMKIEHGDHELQNGHVDKIITLDVQEDEDRLVREIDLRILPILGLLYTICLIDRGNISVARISGLDADLNLTVGSRASIVLLVFFIGYALLEVPSNIAIKRVGPATWLSLIVIAWGAISIGMGFVQSWVIFAILRALLGSFEAGLYPGCIYLIGSWYTRYEVQKRLTTFFMLAIATSSFGNVLAYGLIQIPNAPHSSATSSGAWRWIYIVEGTVTCAIGFMAYFIIIDFPDSHRNTFLTSRERGILKSRLRRDRGDEETETVTWESIWTTGKDWKTWAFAYMYMSGAIGSQAFTLFLPIILQKSLKFSTALAFTLPAPPAIFSAIWALAISWIADRTHTRGVWMILQCFIGITGLCMTGFLSAPAPRYVGTFFGEAGLNGLVATTLAWQSNSVRGDAKRSVASAIMISSSAVGGIYASLVFREQDAPRYVPGIVACIAVLVGVLVVVGGTMWMFRRLNRLANQSIKVLEHSDKFRYTI